jgi:Rrf2 family protein
MILRNQVEWALHCCSVLAGLPEGRYLSTKVLAEFHGVPKEYLSKALQALSQAGLVLTTLGPSGGYRLARPAAEITFLDIIEAVEGRQSTFVCTNIRENNPCRPAEVCDTRPCSVARIMWQADEAWRASLRGVSLADLAVEVEEAATAEQLQKNYQWLLSRG